MRVFNEAKTTELEEYDLEKGYLRSDAIEIKIPEQQFVKEEFHYEIIETYPNGGEDVKKVIDVEGKPYIEAHTETEEIQVYVPYSEKELAEFEIAALKAKLSTTDYQAIKYAEGVLSEEEYSDMKAQRQAWRVRINELEDVR